ncbi:MAG: ankyrin repeat domain-containing protein [Candidatus Marinarcus sp.]|uniref:ankyrin repeat domain-containing protein n=1 Tax=Candidatus Marinarcus sp. TaxID=3100987 RepID=UPI003B0036A5
MKSLILLLSLTLFLCATPQDELLDKFEYAMKNNDAKLLQSVIDLGIDVDEKYLIKKRNTYWTPLFIAISSKNSELFKSLIRKGANINYVDEDGLDLFYFAVYHTQLHMAKELVKAGYKPNINPKSKRHPLAIAVLNNDIEAIKYLLSLGFDPKKELLQRNNLLEFALHSPNKDLKLPPHMFKLIKFDTYKYLIDMFKDELNTQNKFGYHNLLLAQRGEESYKAFKYLVQSGINLHENNNGYSPFQSLSFDNFYEKKVEILLSNNLNINHQDKDGDTPLHQLVVDYSKVLQNIAKIQSQNSEAYYKKDEHKAVISILKQAKLDKKTSYLESAYKKLNAIKSAIKFLISKGANKDIKNSMNKTPYESALFLKIEENELLEILRSKD